MELQQKQNTHTLCFRFCQTAAKQTIDTDWTLPDYCSDIKRILKCLVEPQINAVTVAGERISAGGDVTVRVVYAGEDEQPDCLEQHIRLSVFSDVRGLPGNAVVSAKAAVDYVNCRALSPRKVAVNGTVSVALEVLQKQEVQSVSALEGCEMKTEKAVYHDLGALTEKTFDLSETIELSNENKDVKRLLKTNAAPVVSSIKAVDDKILIKGELPVDVLYLSGSADNPIGHLRHTLPISQIIEAPGVKEQSTLDVTLQTRAVLAEARPDADGNARLLELACKVSALVKAFNKTESEFVTDCYATTGVLKPVFEPVAFPVRLMTLSKSKTLRFTLDAAGAQYKTIADTRLLKESCRAVFRDETLTLECNVLCGMLALDADGRYQYLERAAEFKMEEKLDGVAGAVECEPTLVISELHAQVQEDGQVLLEFQAETAGEVYGVTEMRALKSATLDETAAPEQNGSLILSFSKQGDSLWSIAKHYGTSAEAIRQENGLQGDALEEDRLLLIPCVR